MELHDSPARLASPHALRDRIKIASMLPKTPTRTDAYVQCNCGGTMRITTVAPVPDKPDKMSHGYECVDCGALAQFEVDKRVAAQPERPA